MRSKCNFSFALMTLRGVSRVPVVSGSFHTLILRRGHLSQLSGLSRLVPSNPQRDCCLGECRISTTPKRARPIESEFQQLRFTYGFLISPSARKSKPLSRDQEVQMCSTIQYWSFFKAIAQHQLSYGFVGVYFEGDHDSSTRIWLHHFFIVKAFTYRFYVPIDCELLPQLYVPDLQRKNVKIW